MRIRQSDLASYARCPQEKKLRDLQKVGALTKPPEQLSRTAFGSVMHHAVHIMEKAYAQGTPDPLGQANATFEYYWDPSNIAGVCDPVTIWAARDTWSGMRRKGLATLEVYWEQLRLDRSTVLGLEVSFTLPISVDGEEHELHGTIDRLSLRRGAGGSFINVEDYKTGLDYRFLRWNTQFTVYSWATLQRAFWDQWEEPGVFERYERLARRGTWISLRDGAKRSDAGYRGPQDFQRMFVAIREYIRAVKADIYPLNLTGSTCNFCQFREGLCGGVAVPDENHGRY